MSSLIQQPAASIHKQTVRVVLSFPPGASPSSPFFCMRRCPGLGHVLCRAGCCSWSCMAATRLPQHSCESWPAVGEKDFSLGFPCLFFPLVIKVTFSLPSVGFFEDAIEDLSTALFPVENRAKRLPASLSRSRRN